MEHQCRSIREHDLIPVCARIALLSQQRWQRQWVMFMQLLWTLTALLKQIQKCRVNLAHSLGDQGPAQGPGSPRLFSRCWTSVSFTSSQITASPQSEVLGRDLFTLLRIIFHGPSAWRTEICLVSPIVCSHSQSVYLRALLALKSWRSACPYHLDFERQLIT